MRVQHGGPEHGDTEHGDSEHGDPDCDTEHGGPEHGNAQHRGAEHGDAQHGHTKVCHLCCDLSGDSMLQALYDFQGKCD